MMGHRRGKHNFLGCTSLLLLIQQCGEIICHHLFPTMMCSLTQSFCLSLILSRAYDVPHPVLGTRETALNKPFQSLQVLGRRQYTLNITKNDSKMSWKGRKWLWEGFSLLCTVYTRTGTALRINLAKMLQSPQAVKRHDHLPFRAGSQAVGFIIQGIIWSLFHPWPKKKKASIWPGIKHLNKNDAVMNT